MRSGGTPERLEAVMWMKLKVAAAVMAAGMANSVAYQAPAEQESKGKEHGSGDELTARNFENIHRLIRPQAGEWKHREIPWIEDLWAARKKASAENKPIFYFCNHGAGYNNSRGIC